VPALTVVHDLAFERFPEAYAPWQLAYLRATTRWAEHVCPLLITVSEATRTDLVRLHGVDPARVVVVQPGGGEEPVPKPDPGRDRAEIDRLGIAGPFALHVGRVEPRKNQLAALAAVERVPGLSLVSIGSVVDGAAAARLRASPRAHLLGPVPDRVRDLLYRRALALVFPSLHEGFGFPVLEAMRWGLPVVTVRTSSLPEVGGEAVLYAESGQDIEGLAGALERLASEPQLSRRLSRAGRVQAGRFSWDACAAGVTEVIRRLLAR
jgi:alpha-1,3-rhamnosyl/mannosyltransferase